MQYSSTLVCSLPFKRMPTACSKMASTWCGLVGLHDRRSGRAGNEEVSFMMMASGYLVGNSSYVGSSYGE